MARGTNFREARKWREWRDRAGERDNSRTWKNQITKRNKRRTGQNKKKDAITTKLNRLIVSDLQTCFV